MEINSFLGTGWSFPPAFTKVGNTALMSENQEDIEESIRIILGTIPGERIMQPDFGCDLKKLVFEKVDSILISELNHIIYHALLNYEPRINLIDVALLMQDDLRGMLHLQLNYTIIITNTRHNMVYPFYFLEGTSITTPNILPYSEAT
jgi:phage baseplate assembly protein W